MSPDPAAVRISLTIAGLDRSEIAALLPAMPNGATWNGTTTRPVLGGMRFEVSIANLSVVGAGGLLESLRARWESLNSESGDDQ